MSWRKQTQGSGLSSGCADGSDRAATWSTSFPLSQSAKEFPHVADEKFGHHHGGNVAETCCVELLGRLQCSPSLHLARGLLHPEIALAAYMNTMPRS